MADKKPGQKYSSLLPPVNSETPEEIPRQSSEDKRQQKYESLLSPPDSTSRNGNNPRPPSGSMLTPDDELVGPSSSRKSPSPSPSNEPPPFPVSAGDEPPPYANDAAIIEDDLVAPDTLLLAGTEIHRTGNAESLPLYKLSLAIGHLRESNSKVSISRYDYSVRNAFSLSAGSPRIATREKHIYDLTRLPDIMMSKFQYYLESVGRSSMGHIGLKTHRGIGPSGFRAWRVTRKNKASELQQGDMMFDIKSKGKGLFEWRDPADKRRVLALETSDMGIYRLEVKETMDRQRRDALVSTWCLKLWWEIAVSNIPPLTWDEGKCAFLVMQWGDRVADETVKRILQTRTGEFPAGTAAGY